MNQSKSAISFGEMPRVAYELKILSVVPKHYLTAANQPFFFTESSEQVKQPWPRCCPRQLKWEELAKV